MSEASRTATRERERPAAASERMQARRNGVPEVAA